ncbi:NADPH:quinone reductase [Actinoplanes ianthinogenes]|uniref:NADPH:quinone reductase n=1 Tax=Actinoplanes ianthinogenes TaxID=122358 RepID=A0ABN6CRN6_9ACTN|nr:NADP-dependent oxidoreductase [Actinoplanes ianthinogenes]BCJ47795.1 NADPH:quinone reductase [Actinoplanes ianthinogenes]GGR04199.1 NADPH:quinone reductase [Actinoplanes ianthinogenes]
MRAVVVTALGGPDVLRFLERPDPEPGPGQVLVRVRAACVHPADVAARVGQIPGGPVPPPFLLGWDIAGEVVTTGEHVSGFAPGDTVAGMIPWHLTRGAPGGYAELVAADAGWLVPVPDGLDPVLAATVPLNALTAHRALEIMALPGPATVLVTGASGGVGGFAAQLAVRAGHTVIASATDDDEDWVRGLGVHTVLPRAAAPAVGSVSAVLDAVPMHGLAGAAAAAGGIVVSTRPAPPIDADREVRQETVFVRENALALLDLVEAVADGRLRTRVAATFPLADAAEAHCRFERGGLRGKLVLVA